MSNKPILYSIFAGMITGVVVGLLPLSLMSSFNEMLREIVMYQLTSANASKEVIEEALSKINETLIIVMWITPIATTIQMILIGALFGILHRYFINKYNIKPWYSALIVGVIFILLTEAIPIFASLFLNQQIINIVFKYINPFMIFIPGILYTILLILFSSIKGPWAKLLRKNHQCIRY